MVLVLGYVFFKIFSGAGNEEHPVMLSDTLTADGICTISAKNYTNILKTVHGDVDTYVGMKISFVGYVYRVTDLEENQFILARNMIVSSDGKCLVVGFLSQSENAKDFEDDTWVEIIGEITKGDYHGTMPIIKITEMKKVDKPNEEFVYPADESYIPTSSVL